MLAYLALQYQLLGSCMSVCQLLRSFCMCLRSLDRSSVRFRMSTIVALVMPCLKPLSMGKKELK